MARLSICLFGPYRVTLDGEPVTGFKTRKARALLAYLAVEADRPHHRKRLAGLLWPDSPNSAARASLRVALGEVRRAIGDHAAEPPHLLRSRQTIQFNRASDSWIDVMAFTSLVQESGDPGQDDPQSISRLEEAIELYLGEFLDGFSVADSDLFEDWALVERGHLERLAMESMQRLVAWHEGCGQFERALEYARRQVDLDPWQEGSHRELMRLLALNGQWAAALKQYEICCELLRVGLDAGPDDKTIELCEQIKAGELEPPLPPSHPSWTVYVPPPVPGPDELPEPGDLPPGSRLPFGRNALFTGRCQPLRALARALLPPLPSAREGPGRTGTLITQTIHGMGGIGKTQLAVEFAYRYGRFFHGVHWLSCAQPEAIAAQVALCGTAMGLQPWPQEQPKQVRFTLQVWRRDAPRLVVLDNLEDIDATSEWLPQLTGSGVRLLLTARRRDWPLELGLVPLELRVFSPDESLAYLRRYLPQARANDAELKALAKRLGHLPLALRLAGRYLARLGRLTVPEYLSRLSDVFADPAMRNWQAGLGELRGHDLDLAGSFFRSWQQVADEPAQRLFLLAGYCAPNQPIPCELLEAAAELDREACDEALSLLVGLGLLNLDDPAAGPTIHPLLAEFARALPTLGAGLVPSGAGAEETGEEAFSPLPALVAALASLTSVENHTGTPACFVPLRLHLEAAVPAAEAVAPERAATLWTNLGYHLDMAGDYPGARTALQRALEIREEVLTPGHPLFALTYNLLGMALHDLGDVAAARAAYERALAIDQTVFGPDHPNVTRHLHRLGLLRRDLGDLAGARAAFERALALSQKQHGPDHPIVARDLNALGEVLRDMGDYAGARAAHERALAIDQAAYGPDHVTVAWGLINLGRVLRELGDLAGARVASERALAIDEAAYGPDHPHVARDLDKLGLVLRELGDLAGARAAGERALAICEKQVGPEHPHVATTASHLGRVLQDLGDYTGARAAFERALAIDEAVFGPIHPHVARDVYNLGEALRRLGDLAEARAAFERARGNCEQQLGPEHPHVAAAVNNLGLVLRDQGDYTGARDAFERALAIDQAAFGPDHHNVGRDINNLGDVLLALGDSEGARAAHQRALAIWEGTYGREHPETAQAIWCLGTLALETGDVARAREHLEEALAILQTFLPSQHPHIQKLCTQLETLPPEAAVT